MGAAPGSSSAAAVAAGPPAAARAGGGAVTVLATGPPAAPWRRPQWLATGARAGGGAATDHGAGPLAARTRRLPAPSTAAWPAARLAAALVASRGGVVTARGDVAAALLPTGVGAALAAADAATLAGTGMELLRLHARTGPRRAAANSYAEHCRKHGVAAHPVTADGVLSWLVARATLGISRRGRGAGAPLKSSGLDGSLSGLANAYLPTPHLWHISAAELQLLKRAIGRLQTSLPCTVDHAGRLPLADLLVVLADHAPRTDWPSRRLRAYLAVALALAWRGEDGDGARLEDVTLTPHGVIHQPSKTKTAPGTIGEREARYAPHLPPRLHLLCAARALTDYLGADTAAALGPGAARPSGPMFTVGLTGPGAHTAWPAADALAALTAAMQRLGRPVAPRLDVHWPRASCQSLYFTELRFDEPMLDACGGWAPTTTRGVFYSSLAPADFLRSAYDAVVDGAGHGEACCGGSSAAAGARAKRPPPAARR